MKYLLILGLFLTSKVSLACRCAELDAITKQEVKDATDIFIGKVVAVDTLVNSDKVIYSISVTETIKGEQRQERIVKTSISGAACGLTLKLGDVWFFFITSYKGELRVNMCGRHLNITKPHFRFCKNKCSLNTLNKAQYTENMDKVEDYKAFISAMNN